MSQQANITTTRSMRARLSAAVASGAIGLALIVGLSACVGASDAAETVSLPKSFPTSIPLAGDKDDVVAADKQGSAWNVTVAVDDAAAQEKALKALEKAGFVVIGENETSSSERSYSLSNGTHSVRLGFSKTDDGFVVNYGVAKTR